MKDANTWVAWFSIIEGAATLCALVWGIITFRAQSKKDRYSIEQETIKSLFSSIISKDIPDCLEKIKLGEDAYFSLADLIEQIHDNSRYFKYTLPIFYDNLIALTDDITDWLEYEDYQKCMQEETYNICLEEKVSSLIILIDNALKGERIRNRKGQIELSRAVRHSIRNYISNNCLEEDDNNGWLTINDASNKLYFALNKESDLTSLEVYPLERSVACFHFEVHHFVYYVEYFKHLLKSFSPYPFRHGSINGSRHLRSNKYKISVNANTKSIKTVKSSSLCEIDKSFSEQTPFLIVGRRGKGFLKYFIYEQHTVI